MIFCCFSLAFFELSFLYFAPFVFVQFIVVILLLCFKIWMRVSDQSIGFNFQFHLCLLIEFCDFGGTAGRHRF